MKNLGAIASITHSHEKYTFRDAGFKKIIIALTAASIINFANLYFVQPITPLLARTYSVSSATAGLSISAAVISMVIGLLFFSFLSDRVGRIPIMHITLLCTLLPLAVMPLVHSFELFLVLRFIQGIFMAGLPAAAIAYISDEVDSKSVGLGITMYIAANAIGGTIGRIFVGTIADVTSLQTSLFALLALEAVLFVIYFLILPKSYFFAPSDRSMKNDLAGMFSHVGNTMLIPAFLMGILLQFSFTGVWTFLPFYLEKEPFHLSVSNISFTYLAYFAGTTGAMVAGRISIHVKKTTIVSVGIIILICGTLMTNIQSLGMVIVGLCLVCLGFFVSHSIMAAIVNERATHHKAGASSLYLVCYYIGVATGGTLVGHIWESVGWFAVTAISLLVIPFAVITVRQGGRKLGKRVG